MRCNCLPLTNHDSGEALQRVEGALGPAVLGLTGQREVCQVLQGERTQSTCWRTAGCQTAQSEEGALTYQVVALRLKGVRSANIEALGVYSLEDPDVVETVRLWGDAQRGFIRLQTESEAARLMRTSLYLFGFPFQCALIHKILGRWPLNLKTRPKSKERKLANVEKYVLFFVCFFFPLCYLVASDRHVGLAELKDGLPGAHVQSVPLLTQQQSGVVKDAWLRELHQVQIWAIKNNNDEFYFWNNFVIRSQSARIMYSNYVVFLNIHI